MLAPQVNGRDVMTISGVMQTKIGEKLMKKFIEHDAAQCGYCIPGMVTTAFCLIKDKNNTLEEDEIKYMMAGNLCRCGGYPAQIKAIKEASSEI